MPTAVATRVGIRTFIGRSSSPPPTPPPQGLPLRYRTPRRKLAFELSGRFLGLHHVRGHLDQFGDQPIGALALTHVILPVAPRTLFEHGKLCLQHLDPRREYGDRPGGDFAHDRACEAELAHAIDADLNAGCLP